MPPAVLCCTDGRVCCSQEQADPLPAALEEASVCLCRLERLLAEEAPAWSELGHSLAACSSAADRLSSLVRRRAGQEPRAVLLLTERHHRLRTAAHGRLQQRELDRWRLTQWLTHTAGKLDSMPTADLLSSDDLQLRRLNVSRRASAISEGGGYKWWERQVSLASELMGNLC